MHTEYCHDVRIKPRGSHKKSIWTENNIRIPNPWTKMD